jgi:hypothetical protein
MLLKNVFRMEPTHCKYAKYDLRYAALFRLQDYYKLLTTKDNFRYYSADFYQQQCLFYAKRLQGISINILKTNRFLFLEPKDSLLYSKHSAIGSQPDTHTNALHILKHCFVTIYINIILPSTVSTRRVSFPSHLSTSTLHLFLVSRIHTTFPGFLIFLRLITVLCSITCRRKINKRNCFNFGPSRT